MDTDRRREAEPTRRIEQHYVLSGVDAAFLSERCSDLLRPLVKLHTGRRANCYTLEDRSHAQITRILSVTVKAHIMYFSAYKQFGTLALRRTKRTWSGSVWALQ